MLAFLLRRIFQSVLVVAVMAILVFVGVYALGNPIDILISPEADQLERAQAIARLGLDRPLWVQFWLFVTAALHGDLGTSFVHGVPAVGLILSRMPATLELALVALVIAVGAGVPLGPDGGPRAAVAVLAHRHGRLDLRLLAAELLARPDADPAVRRQPACPAGGRARRDPRVVRHLLVARHARRAAPSDPAGAHARDLQGLAGGAAGLCGHPRGDAAGLRPLRPRQGPRRPRASSACTCSRPC